MSVLIVGAVGSAAAISLLLLGLGGSQSGFSLEQSNQAKGLANACQEEALKQIRGTVNYEGSGSLNLGQGSCSYTVTKGAGQNRTVTAQGTVGSEVRKVKVEVGQITPKITLTSWQEVADF